MSFPFCQPRYDICEQDEKGDEDGNHRTFIALGLQPYFREEVDAAKDFYGCPEDDDRGDGHPDVGSPRRQTELLAEYINRADEAAEADEECYGIVVADEPRVIAEHQEKITRP